jgi:hypothetical protein
LLGVKQTTNNHVLLIGSLDVRVRTTGPELLLAEDSKKKLLISDQVLLDYDTAGGLNAFNEVVEARLSCVKT